MGRAVIRGPKQEPNSITSSSSALVVLKLLFLWVTFFFRCEYW